MFWIADNNLRTVWVNSPNSRENDVRSGVKKRMYNKFDSSEEEEGVDCKVGDTNAA
jgi:hypothetical protein